MSFLIVNIGVEVEFINGSRNLLKDLENMKGGSFVIDRTRYMPHISMLFLIINHQDLDEFRGRLPQLSPGILRSSSNYRSEYKDTTVRGLNVISPELISLKESLKIQFSDEIIETRNFEIELMDYSHKEWVCRGISNNSVNAFHITLGDKQDIGSVNPNQEILMKSLYLKKLNKYCSVSYDI